MHKEVNFKFWIDDEVEVTPTGEKGVISWCGVDDAQQTEYLVKTSTNGTGAWWPERHIKMQVKMETK